MSDTVGNYYGITSPTGWKSIGSDKYSEGTCPSLLYGVELEIEDTSEDAVVQGFSAVADGSLRNNGWEFISKPMTYPNLVESLYRFFSANEFTSDNYSERCSVHVHTNCLNLTFEQVGNIVMLYQVLERVLFNFIGEDRDKNIFCVPLYETNITSRAIHRLQSKNNDVFRDWHKYTALNLLPLNTQGTIEWRHMAGTCNVEFICIWLRLIGHIYTMAINNSKDTLENLLTSLNTSSQYKSIIDMVFKDDAKYVHSLKNAQLLEEGVLSLKYSLMSFASPATRPISLSERLSRDLEFIRAPSYFSPEPV